MKATHTLTGEHVLNRPTRQTDGMARRAAALALDALVRHRLLDASVLTDAFDREATLDDLATVIDDDPPSDSAGYDRARSLDRRGWAITDEMVELLGDDFIGRAVDAAVRAWVADEGIEPSLTVGASVHVEYQDAGYAGVITAINREMATYRVTVVALGHVTTGPGTLGLILPYEMVEP